MFKLKRKFERDSRKKIAFLLSFLLIFSLALPSSVVRSEEPIAPVDTDISVATSPAIGIGDLPIAEEPNIMFIEPAQTSGPAISLETAVTTPSNIYVEEGTTQSAIVLLLPPAIKLMDKDNNQPVAAALHWQLGDFQAETIAGSKAALGYYPATGSYEFDSEKKTVAVKAYLRKKYDYQTYYDKAKNEAKRLLSDSWMVREHTVFSIVRTAEKGEILPEFVNRGYEEGLSFAYQTELNSDKPKGIDYEMAPYFIGGGYDLQNLVGHNVLQEIADFKITDETSLGNLDKGYQGFLSSLRTIDTKQFTLPSNSTGLSREKLIEGILARECNHGAENAFGWNFQKSLSGYGTHWRFNTPYVSTTIDVLSVLAPYYNTHPEVKASIDRALAYLSTQQKEDGSLLGDNNYRYNTGLVQVLSELGIDANTDGRFIKNGISLLDYIENKTNSDGAYVGYYDDETPNDQEESLRHLPQLYAYKAMKEGGKRYWDLSDFPEKNGQIVKVGILKKGQINEWLEGHVIQSPDPIEVLLGTTPEDAIKQLPKLKLQDSMHRLIDLDTQWMLPGYDPSKPANYQAIGTYTLPPKVEGQPQEITVQVTVQQEVSKDALSKLITQAESKKPESLYTEATWASLQSALQKGKSIASKDNPTQPELEAAIRELTNSLVDLKERRYVREVYLSRDGKELEIHVALGATWADVLKEINKSAHICAKDDQGTEWWNIAVFFNGSANKTNFSSTNFDSSKPGTYEGWYRSPIEIKLPEGLYQPQTPVSLNPIKFKIVVESPVRDQLQSEVLEGQKLSKEDFTIESFAAFQQALLKAQEALADKNASTEKLQLAWDELKVAKSQLQKKLVVDQIPQIPLIEVAVGTSEAEVLKKLPAKIQIQDSLKKDWEIQLSWKIEKYNANSPGYYPAKTSFTLPEGAPPLSAALKPELTTTIMVKAPAKSYQEVLQQSLHYIYTTTPQPQFGSVGGEWTVFDLGRGDYPVSMEYIGQYKRTIINMIRDKKGQFDGHLHESSSTEHSRLVFGLNAIGIDPTNVDGYNVVEALGDFDYVTKQGVNGPIFALIALDTKKYEIPKAPQGKQQVTRDKLIDYILSKEINYGYKDAGGWSYGSPTADPDMSGMAIQGLAPYYNTRSDVKAAVDRALKKLSELQRPDGGFDSWGTTNSESIVQVIVALTALGRDPDTEPMFVKGNNTLVSALLAFAVPGGGFKHTMYTDVNAMATDQGTYALIAYDRFKRGKNRLYDMTDKALLPADAIIAKTPDIIVDGIKDKQAFSEKTFSVKIKSFDYQGKQLTPSVHFNNQEISGADNVYKLDFVKEQNTLKIIAKDAEGNQAEKIFRLIYYPKPDPSNPGGGGLPPEGSDTVTFSIDKETIGKGYVLEPQKVELRTGDSVWDVFQRELTRRGIPFRYSFNSQYNSVYIESIDGDGEFDHGSGSGWMYNVNGTYPQFGASLIYPKPGDTIQWRYTTNLGDDIGGSDAMGGDAGLRKTLEQYLQSAKAYNKNEYTAASYKTLQEAIDHGEKVLKEYPNDKTKLLEAVQQLNKAIKAMEKLSSGQITQNYKEELKKKLEEIDNMKLDPSKYDKASYEAFMKALKNAKEAYEKGDISYEELQRILSELENALKKLDQIAPLPAPVVPVVQAPATSNLPEVDYSYQYGDQSQISSWATQAVVKAKSYGLMAGDQNNSFNPKKTITRAEIAALLSNFIGEVPYDKSAKKFQDVSKDKWYYEAIEKVTSLGLLAGLSEDVFSPQGVLTREQFAVIILNMMNYDRSVLASPQDKEHISSWAQDAVAIVFGRGIMSGDGAKFDPKAPVTREMAAVIMVKLYEEKHQTQK